MFFLVVEERVSIEVNHAISDAAMAETLADGFGYANDNLGSN